MRKSTINMSSINQTNNTTNNFTSDSPSKMLSTIVATKDKPRYLNIVHPDSFFTQKAPHNFDPKCLFGCKGPNHPRECEKFRRPKNYLPMSPTLERLNIEKYDKIDKLDKLVVKHISEYLPQYMKQLRTVDKQRIKDQIFRSVIKEVISIDQRRSARRWFDNMKPEEFNLDESISPAKKEVVTSPKLTAAALLNKSGVSGIGGVLSVLSQKSALKTSATPKKVKIDLPAGKGSSTSTRAATPGVNVTGGSVMNRSFVSQKSSYTAKVVDPWAEKTVEDMDRLIDVAFRKSTIEHKKFDRLRARAGKKPSMVMKEQMVELRKEIRKTDVELTEYREVKETKIPYWDKLKDHCSATPYYRFTINKMFHTGLLHAVDIKLDEEKVIGEGYRDRLSRLKHR